MIPPTDNSLIGAECAADRWPDWEFVGRKERAKVPRSLRVSTMNVFNAAREVLVREVLMIAAISPLLILGFRKSPAAGQTASQRCRLIGWAVLLLVVTNTMTGIDWLQPAGLNWSWSGKALCIASILILFYFLPSEIRSRSGLFRLPERSSILAVIGFLGYCLSIGLYGGYAARFPFDPERVAFQLFMPSLAEEPVYRGILPALLSSAIGSPWKIAGTQLGWWWIAIAAYFGLGHAIGWTNQGDFRFDTFNFFLVTIYVLPYGWIAARTGSIWPGVVGHSMNNTLVALGLFRN